MSALFNFESLLLVIILSICTCTYLHAQIPAVMDRNKHGYYIRFPRLMDSMLGIFWKFARIGERLSPYVSICCILMAVKSSEICADISGVDVEAVMYIPKNGN